MHRINTPDIAARFWWSGIQMRGNPDNINLVKPTDGDVWEFIEKIEK